MPGPVLGEISEKNPVFLDELIQIAETSVAFHYANVVDQKMRAQLTDALQKTMETQVQWAGYVKKKVKAKYGSTQKKLNSGEEKLIKAYQAYVKTINLDSPSKVFYEGFTKGLYSLAEVVCEYYIISRLAFIEGPEDELVVAFDSLKKVWDSLAKVNENPSHENKDALVDNYQEGTELYAQLAEATSTLAVQPTTEEPVRVVLNGFFNSLNDLNDALADQINDTLQADPARVKDVFPKAEFSFRELEYLINDLSIIIEDERKKIQNLNLYPIFLRGFELAKDSEVLKKEIEDTKENDTITGSAAKKLDELQKATGKPNAPALVDLAKNADIIDKGLKDIAREMDNEKPDNGALDKALQDIKPALAALPKNVEDALKHEKDNMKNAAAKGKDGIDERIKELDELAKKNDALQKKMSPAGPYEPGYVDEVEGNKEELRDIAAKALKDVSPDLNVNVFGNEKGDAIRKDMADRAFGPKISANPTNAKDEVKKLGDEIKDTRDKLQAYKDSLDDTVKKNSDLADQVAKDIPPALIKSGDKLMQAGKDVMASGPEGGRKEKLLKAADNLAGLVDTTVGLIPGNQDIEHSRPGDAPKAADPKRGAAANQLVQNAADNGQDVPEDLLNLAKGIDRARERVNGIDDAGDKNDKKGLEDAVKKDPEALKDLGKEAGAYLAQEPDKIGAAATKAGDALGEREKQLDQLAKKADELAKKVGDSTKPADPKDKDALTEIQKALEKELEKAKGDISPNKNPHLFSGREPETLRSDLNDLIGDVEKGLQKEPATAGDLAKEARHLADEIRGTKDKIADFHNDLPQKAKEKAALADKVAKGLPETAKQVSDQLDDAAKNAAKDPQDPAKKRKLKDAVDDANAFIDSIGGLLPSAPVQATLGGLARMRDNDEGDDLVNMDKNHEGYDRKPVTEAEKLAHSKQPVNPKAKDLATAIDRADKALADVRDANDSPKAADRLPKPLNAAIDPINEVGKAAADILSARPEEIMSAAGQCRPILSQSNSELDEIKKKADDLAQQADKNGGKLTPEDGKKLAALQDKLRDVAGKAGDAVDTNKNPSLFSTPEAAKLRNELADTASPDSYKPIDPQNATKDDVVKLANKAKAAKDALNDVDGKLDGEAKKQADLAKDLAAQLPQAFSKAAEDLGKEGKKVIADDKKPENKAALDNAADNVDDLLDVARSLLPSSSMPPDNNTIAQAIKKAKDPQGNRKGDDKKKEPINKFQAGPRKGLDDPAGAEGTQVKKFNTPPHHDRSGTGDSKVPWENRYKEPSAVDRLKDLEAQGGSPSPNEHELAKSADDARDALKDLKEALASGDPKALEEALKKVAPTANRLGNAAGKTVGDEPDAIAKALQFKKKGADKDLADLVDEIDRLRKKFNIPDIPKPEEKAAMEDYRAKLKKVAGALRDELNNKNSNLFDDIKSQKLRDLLDKLAALEENPNATTPDELKRMADLAQDAKQQLADVLGNAQKEAQKSADLANKLKNQLPKALQRAADAVIVAANDVIARGPEDGRREKLAQAINDLDNAVAAAESQLPTDDKSSLKDLQRQLNDAKPEPSDALKKLLEKDKPEAERQSATDQLNDYAKKSGDAPTEPQKRLANAADRLNKGLAGIKNTADSTPFNKDTLSKNVALSAPAASDLSHAVADALKDRADDLKNGGQEAERTLGQDADNLRDIAAKLREQEKKPDPKQVEDLKKQLDKALERALADVSPYKNPDLFNDPETDQLRDELQKIKDSLTGNPDAKKLAEAAEKASNKLNEYKGSLPEKANLQKNLAANLARELPKAIRDANGALVSAANDVASKGPQDGRKEKLRNARDHLDGLLDTARCVNPNTSRAGTLKSIQKDLAAKKLAAPPVLPKGVEPVPKYDASRNLEKATRPGESPSDAQQEVAANVDKAANALDELASAVTDPNRLGGLADGINEAAPALNDLARALAEMLEKEPQNIRDSAQKAKDNLKDRKKQLDELQKEMDKLKNKIKANGATAQDAKDLATIRKKFRDIVHLAQQAVEPRDTIFGNLRSNKLRAFLGGKLEDLGDESKDAAIKPAEVQDELKKLEDMVGETKKRLGDFEGKVDDDAEEAAAKVQELATELPKYTRNLNSRLVKSARGIAATGPEADLVDKMMSSRDQMSQLLGAVAGMLPGSKTNTDLDSILDFAKGQNRLEGSQDTGVKDKNVTKKLDQYAKQKGISPSDAMYRVAFACERVDGALDEVLRSVTNKDRLDSLAEASDVTTNALEDLGEALIPLLEAQVDELDGLAVKTDRQLEGHAKELAELSSKANAVREGIKKKGGKADAQDTAALNELKEAYSKLSQRMVDDLAVSKNANIFGHSKATKLRAHMNKTAKYQTVTDPNETAGELERLFQHLNEADEGVSGFKGVLGDIVKQNQNIALGLAEELPRLIRVAQDKLTKASGSVINEGVSEKRKEKVFDAAESIAAVVNAATSLLPSSGARGDLRNARDIVEDFSADSSEDGPYLDSVKQYYADSLKPPRAPQSADADSKPKKSVLKFKNAAKSLIAQKQKQQDQELKATASWGGKLSHLVSYLENPDAKYAVQNSVVLPEGALNLGFGAKKEEENKDSIWNQKGALKVETKANKEITPKSGTLNHLVLLFTTPMDGESSKEEGELLRKSLLTLDTFTTPATFLDKLIERYEGPKQRQLSAFEQNLQAKVQKRVCSALKTYILNRANQDLTYRPDLVAKIQGFIKTVEKDSKYLAKDLTDCLNLNTSNEQYKYHEKCGKGQVDPTDTRGAEAEPLPFSKQLGFFSPQDAARQMTLVDGELFRMIRLPEIAAARWTQADAAKTAPNVTKMIQHGNMVSIWTASAVLSEEDIKKRKKILINMIVLCQHLINMNNFHGAKSVLAGLQSSPILRLTFPGEDLNERIRKLASNYEEKVESARTPLIPFIGSTLKELIFYEHDRPNTTTQLNPSIDWERQSGLQSVLSEFVEQQRLCVYKIPEAPMKKSILKSVDELQQPISKLLQTSKKYATQVEEAAPQGSLSGALERLKMAQA